MPYSSKRIQVLLHPKVRDVLENFSTEEGLTNSKACSLLIEEALKARGLYPDTTTSEAPSKAADVSPVDLQEALTAMGAQTVMRKTEPLSDDDARSLKLKLMQDLMEQIKSV